MATRRRWTIWALCGLLLIVWGTVVIPQPESPGVDTTDTAPVTEDQVKRCSPGVTNKEYPPGTENNYTGTWSAYHCDGAPTDC